ncbi:proline-specific permease ProY, partial [Escherichia coli]|nr:proline-specific permease ProY [Escherichia coli]
ATTIGGFVFLLFFFGVVWYYPDKRISLYVWFAWGVLLLVWWVFQRRPQR